MAKFSGYIGSYTEGTGKSKGIYSFSMDADSGVIEDIHLAAEIKNPSYLAFAPSGKFLYAVNELGSHGGKPQGGVSAFAVEADRSLKFINTKGSGGEGPCHINIHKGGTFAVVSNYSGGVLAVLPIGKNGRLGGAVQLIQYQGTGPNKGRQEKAHAHSFTFAPDFSTGFACDLGSDKVMLYRFDPKARKPLIPWEQPFAAALPGCGPRHGVFHPNGKIVYVLNELKSTVDVFAFSGGLRSGGKGPSVDRIQAVSSLPKRSGKDSIAAALRISADGKFLYASNRGHDSIAVFKVSSSGLLDLVDIVSSGGQHPRDFILAPQGNFLIVLNKDSDNLVIFKINRRTGLLKKEREYPALSPTAIIFRQR
ncbi:MAG: lactonase family protein [Treponema sp.]|jgi:6-phosphogluconolactonase|nr:lactonase family protein [Treponema sp.]